MKGELQSVRKAINVLIRGGIPFEKCPLNEKIESLFTKFGWDAKK